MVKKITLAHSPDSDDAFMFYALATGKLTSDKYRFEVIREDIETLNHLAQKEKYDITALSFHAYAYVADKYVLTSSGASFAEKNYGPIVVGKRAHELTSVRAHENQKAFTIAIPGELTTAALVLKMIAPDITTIVMPFDQIIDAVLNDEVDTGLLIHEGQLQYEKFGLKKILSLIDSWNALSQSLNSNTSTLEHLNTSPLPLPLGGNAIKSSLGKNVVHDLSIIVQNSIRYALEHANEARDYARQFKRDLSEKNVDLYLSWYANQRTLDMGEEGRTAIQKLLDLAADRELIPRIGEIEIV